MSEVCTHEEFDDASPCECGSEMSSCLVCGIAMFEIEQYEAMAKEEKGRETLKRYRLALEEIVFDPRFATHCEEIAESALGYGMAEVARKRRVVE